MGERALEEAVFARGARAAALVGHGSRIADYLIRVAEDDGALIRDADEPVDALLLALGVHRDEAELVRAAIVLLRRDGFLAGGARSLFVHNLPAAQAWEIQKSQAFWEFLRFPERQTSRPSSSICGRERRYSERYKRRYKRYFERHIGRFFGCRDG
ncbi:MAG TPA: hypothetical protein VGC79_20800 [Polyangiaceae bacterium]